MTKGLMAEGRVLGETAAMKREQKIVAIGAASGVACMALAVWALTSWLPSPAGIDTMPDRIVYALRVNLVALVPFFCHADCHRQFTLPE